MKITDDSPPVLTALDRPNSYIGRSVPRPNVQRLTQGRGQYVSDVTLPRMAHVAFVRSPHAHARIVNIENAAAEKSPGVIAVVTGAELAKVMTPWVGVLTHLKGLKSAPQSPIAVERACWQGEAVSAVVARTRAQAEDACELVEVSYEQLPAVVDPETALDAKTPVIHPSLGDNLCFERKLDVGKVDEAFASSDAVVETTFVFGRHTGVTNEPRSIVADWNRGRADADGVPRHAGAAHDAGPVRQAPRHRRTPGARASRRTSAARSASRCTPTPTRWRRWRCRSCSSGR